MMQRNLSVVWVATHTLTISRHQTFWCAGVLAHIDEVPAHAFSPSAEDI